MRGNACLSRARGVEQSRDAVQRILRRIVAVARREQRRPLRMRTVIRAARGHADPSHFAILEHLEHLPGLGERRVEIAVLSRPKPAGYVIGIDRGHTRAIRALAMRDEVERREAHHHLKSRHVARMPSMISRMKRVRFSRLPPKRPGPLMRAEQLVSEIAVTVFDVDELKAGLGRQLRGGDEIVDQPADVVVTQHPER